MPVPLTAHLRELADIGERALGVFAGPSCTHSWPPLSVDERVAAADAPALARSALFWGVVAADGHSEPETAVSSCDLMRSVGQCPTEDVDRDESIAACTRRSGN